MNSPVVTHPTGLPHRAFTVAEMFRMAEAGVIAPDERLELIAGELLPMSPKGARHEWLKTYLNRHFGKCCPDSIGYSQEFGWRIDDFHYLEPDFVFFPASVPLGEVKGNDALLVIEVSDTSLNYDLGIKAGLYASLGIADYWVIDALRLRTHVHRLPSAGGYGALTVVESGAPLVPLGMADLAVTLADLGARM